MSPTISGCARVVVLSAAALLGAAGCQGSGGGGLPGTPAAQEVQAQAKIIDAFRQFHTDTGGWPMGGSIWYPSASPGQAASPQVDGLSFSENDTALFKLPSGVKQCSAEVSHNCWNGPYLQGQNLAEASLQDQWGHPRLFALIRPLDGQGGGARTAPSGAIVIWSAGPDGHDGFACTDATCARNWERIGQGLSSDSKADDVVSLVGPAK
jgi:hypothetical protein